MIPRYPASFRARARARVRRPAMHALVSFALGLAVLAAPARSASMAPKIHLDSRDLKTPVVLDQDGRWYRHQTGGSNGGGVVPTYVGYRIGNENTVPRDYPAIDTGPRVPGQTVGPLHLTPTTQAQLDATLASNGEAVVRSGSNQALVLPISSNAAGGLGISAWLASQAASSSGAGQSMAQMLNLDKISQPITNSQVLKDLNHLLTLKSGKFVNWNQQSLDALKRDLKLGSPKNVTTHPVVAGATTKGTAKGTTAAQMLDGTGASGNVLAAPVPEPGTYLIFGLAAGAFAARRRLGSRAA